MDEEQAVLFDIQRLSLRDGNGIRTSLFFKGCPLRCIWCHNPEGLTSRSQMSYVARQCVGCGLCEKECKYSVHTFPLVDGFYRHHTEQTKCTLCGACLKVCCYGAIDIIGKRYTVDELVRLLKPDLPYYTIGGLKKGGGITLTGGEPMLYSSFIKKFLKKIPGIHVCMETSGYADTAYFLELLPYIDQFLFDYKVTNPQKHIELCGVDNSLILKNLEMLCANNANVVLRLPLIPGVNDDDEHIKAIAELLKKYSAIEAAEIMGYHRLGLSKSENLGMDATLTTLATATEEQKESWLQRIKNHGVTQTVRVG